MNDAQSRFSVFITYCGIGLIVFSAACVLFIMIAALLEKTGSWRVREETPEARARRAQMQAWLDQKVKAHALGIAGSFWGLPLGAMVAA
ncbi:MAG: hypothetical protein ACHQ9S_21415 [Candidatus Binatia bacterium]